MKGALRQTFIGPDGQLRAIWRAAIYYSMGTWLVFPLLGWPFALIAESFHLSPGLTAGNIALAGSRNLAVALICTGVFALYEHRRVDSYGLPVHRAFGRQTFEGIAAGVIMAGGVALGMVALGGMQIQGLAGSGSALAVSALAWRAQPRVSAWPRSSGSAPISNRRSGKRSASGRPPWLSRSSLPRSTISSSQVKTYGM